MKLRQMLMGFLVSATFATGAQANAICSACDYVDGSAGTYLGAHDATTNDLSTFQHIFATASTAFTDLWVFDIAPLADATASADFTFLADIIGFTGALYNAAGGTACAGGPGSSCAAVVLGGLIASDSDPSSEQFKLLAQLAPGTYIIKVDGTTNDLGGGKSNSAYTGQIAFVPGGQLIPEPGTLALLGLGLVVGVLGRRQRRHA
jgi:hypothetical protein